MTVFALFSDSTWVIGSGVTWGLSQVGQSSAEGGPLDKMQKNFKKWLCISGCRGCLYEIKNNTSKNAKKQIKEY